MKLFKKLFFPLYTKVGDGVEFVSISVKVLTIFIFFLLVSNFITNYLNLVLNRNLIINETYNSIKITTFDVYTYANSQYNLYALSNNLNGTLVLIKDHTKTRLNNTESLGFAVDNNGDILFTTLDQKNKLLESSEKDSPNNPAPLKDLNTTDSPLKDSNQTNTDFHQEDLQENKLSNIQSFDAIQSSNDASAHNNPKRTTNTSQKTEILSLSEQVAKLKPQRFNDSLAMTQIKQKISNAVYNDFINFTYNNKEYIGSFYYSPKWNWTFITAESKNFFYQKTKRIFIQISVLIISIVFSFAIIGIMTFRFLFRFLKMITYNMVNMNKTKELSLIDLKNASNDDISFLGLTFNSLAQTVNSLLSIFTKFTSKEVVLKAYEEGRVDLQGESKELTCLFSDIRSFTTITEILKVDIVKLLNLHYDYAIKEINQNEGVVASIIGDAILAVFGVLKPLTNKSYDALISGFTIHHSLELLKHKILEEKNSVVEERNLTEEDHKRINSLLLEIGVGIDGGDVFYGNIGSLERMTNTVIGDSVNSAARLEGLTRIYHVPIIVSDFIKNDIDQNQPHHEFFFMELDQVKVKGKNEGKKIYWPMIKIQISYETKLAIQKYQEALFLYYDGFWEKSLPLFQACNLAPAQVFIERMTTTKRPNNWNGLWNMETK